MKIITLICFFTAFVTYGQQNISFKSSKKNPKNGYSRCSTVEYEEYLRKQNPQRLSTAQFETWIAPIIATQRLKNKNSKTQQIQVVYNIPVVIHVIHNGAPVNTIASHTSENISYAQAVSQINVLNQDFRRILNTPGNGSTGYKLGVDCEINFVLAKQDPQGQTTNGVNRVNMGQAAWSEENMDALVKKETQWDPKKYLNMWVVKLVDDSVLGYAQFPSGSNLAGIGNNGGAAKTDGVVASYDAFGTNAENDGSFVLNNYYNLGRTMTHEVGHWLGLLHIWGDDTNCTPADDLSGDFVADTPDSNKANYDCVTVANCTGNDMIENYMDYTNDACMNTFTAGQKARMVAVMTNSIRRKELASSNGGTAGTAYALDGKLSNITIAVDGCMSSYNRKITIENRGTTTMTTASINYKNNSEATITYNWTGNLAQYESATIDLGPAITIAGAHTFQATITSVNGAADMYVANNTLSKAFTQDSKFSVATPIVTLDLQCDPYGSETTWTLKNSAGTTIYSGGPYTDSDSGPLNPVVNSIFTLTSGECYIFTINDSYGDGIANNTTKGSYTLKDNNGLVITTGADFEFSESKALSISTLAVQAFENSEGFYAYPNPVRDVLNVKVSNRFGLPSSLSITSILGQTVYTKKVSSEADLQINTSALSSGVYFITVLKDNTKKTLRFIKE